MVGASEKQNWISPLGSGYCANRGLRALNRGSTLPQWRYWLQRGCCAYRKGGADSYRWAHAVLDSAGPGKTTASPGDARGDLLVAALGTAQKALDLQTGSLRYHFARRSRGAQEVAAEHAAIGNTKLDHQFFFGVVGDECDVHVYHSFQ